MYERTRNQAPAGKRSVGSARPASAGLPLFDMRGRSAAPFRPHFGLHQLLTAFTPYKLVANLLAMILFGLIVAFSARNVR